jgi:hypothetical protein
MYFSLIGIYCLLTPSWTTKVSSSQSSGAYSKSFSIISPRYLIYLSDWLSFWIYYWEAEVGDNFLGIISDEALVEAFELDGLFYDFCLKLSTYLTGSSLTSIVSLLLSFST